MTDPAALRAELAQALAELDHLRLLVAERKVSAAALAVAEYTVAGLRRRLAAEATDHRQPRGGGGSREKIVAAPRTPGVSRASPRGNLGNG